MKKILVIAFILTASISPIFAYKDMSAVDSRASDLGMVTTDYTFAMAITGGLSGTLFGLFLWKIR